MNAGLRGMNAEEFRRAIDGLVLRLNEIKRTAVGANGEELLRTRAEARLAAIGFYSRISVGKPETDGLQPASSNVLFLTGQELGDLASGFIDELLTFRNGSTSTDAGALALRKEKARNSSIEFSRKVGFDELLPRRTQKPGNTMR